MSSEKSRYLNNHNRPSAPFPFRELKSHLSNLGMNRLVDVLWSVAQRDEVLGKTLMGSIGIQLADGNLEKAKIAINYALDLAYSISYKEHGYGLILGEIKTTLEGLLEVSSNKEFVVDLAEYTCNQGRLRIQNFDDDWDWLISLELLEEWLQRLEAKVL